MVLLGIDLGATKMSWCLFDGTGNVLGSSRQPLDGREGPQVGQLIAKEIQQIITTSNLPVSAIGICVPGISHAHSGTVWAPNIPGWDNYPLLDEVKAVAGSIPVSIDNDRACSLMGEQWLGKAKDKRDVIFLAVGTGIGAGILSNGTIIRGAHDIAGAIGWFTMQRQYHSQYDPCGFFEYHASGSGIAKVAAELIQADPGYNGVLRKQVQQLSAELVFEALDEKDPLATLVIDDFIKLWGMACANMVSLFNPECILFGGGIFGPAARLIPEIEKEASRWAQPISIKQVRFYASELGSNAGVTGAGYLALSQLAPT